MKISEIPVGNSPAALKYLHFPTQFQAVIWRNWNLVPVSKLASILDTTEEKIVESAMEMGLERDDTQIELWKKRGFQTIIRRNWELLDYPQILELLDWQPDELAFTLKEDDFFFYKLGLHKPVAGVVKYRGLTADEKAQTAEIKRIVSAAKAVLPPATEKPFDFLKNYGNAVRIRKSENAPEFELKFIYSYSALYGDPLLEEDCQSYPEGLFADYQANGINGIWLQATLYTLVPWLGEDERCSANWQKRLENLRLLVDRAGKYGVKIYLYLNEPRSMPAEFFKAHPELRGAAGDQDDFALCTSAPGVLEALSAGVERLFREIPGLGGAFTITMSENLTHCRSRWKCCPRCEKHTAAELAAGVNNAIYEGIKRSGRNARIIAYNWAWEADWADDVIRLMDKNIPVMSVSESGLPTDCFGYKGKVSDYSISKVGPGEKARKIWRAARENGSGAVAKIQVNASWELSAMPYIPVPDLVEEHLRNLREAGVSDLMLSWTLGGYPGGNLGLLCCSKEELAQQLFENGSAAVLQAWKYFSDAFRFFPFNNVPTLYFAPQNFGPATILYEKPTGRDASMVGFPFDDIDTWRGAKDNPASPALEEPIPVDIMLRGYGELCEIWKQGLEVLEKFDGELSENCRKNFDELSGVAKACYCHFRSAYLQMQFVLKRDAGEDLTEILQEERELAIELIAAVRGNSCIGYEASNHYFYVENDLLEKVLNCERLLKTYTCSK